MSESDKKQYASMKMGNDNFSKRDDEIDFYSGMAFEDKNLLKPAAHCYYSVIKNTSNKKLKLDSYERLALVYEKMNLFDEAVVVRKKPPIGEFLIDKQIEQNKNKSTDDSIKDMMSEMSEFEKRNFAFQCEDIEEYYPNNAANLYFYKAKAEEAMGWSDAIRHYKKAIKYTTDYKMRREAYGSIALMYEQLLLFDGAAHALKKKWELTPTRPVSIQDDKSTNWSFYSPTKKNDAEIIKQIVEKQGWQFSEIKRHKPPSSFFISYHYKKGDVLLDVKMSYPWTYPERETVLDISLKAKAIEDKVGTESFSYVEQIKDEYDVFKLKEKGLI